MASTKPTHAQPLNPSATYTTTSPSGKSVLITGAASGIREACMRSFLAAGAFVTFGDVASDRALALVSELGQDKVAFTKCDTRVWQDQANLFKTAISSSPSHTVDIVLANAGIAGPDPIVVDKPDPKTGEPVEPDLSIVNTNLIGNLYTTKLALHYFSQQVDAEAADNKPSRDRSLILTSSLAGYADHNGAAQYSAAKHGLRGIMRSLRQGLPKHNARVNMIAPSFVETRILSSAVVAKLQSGGVPFAAVEDAAAAVLHIASDAGVNGRALAILPREMAEMGYVDLEADDPLEGGVIERLQGKLDQISIRAKGV